MKGLAVLVLRYTQPERQRDFRVPLNVRIGLGRITLVPISIAVVNLLTKHDATVLRNCFLAGLFAISRPRSASFTSAVPTIRSLISSTWRRPMTSARKPWKSDPGVFSPRCETTIRSTTSLQCFARTDPQRQDGQAEGKEEELLQRLRQHLADIQPRRVPHL